MLEFINEEILSNTTFSFIERNKLYLYEYYDQINNFSLITDNPKKDNIDYIFTMCNKTEFIRDAIEINPYNTEYFVWIDFGIYHMFDNKDELFIQSIKNIRVTDENNIRIAGSYRYNKDNIYHVLLKNLV